MLSRINLFFERLSNKGFVQELERCENAQDAFWAGDAYDERSFNAKRNLLKAIKFYRIAALRGHVYAAHRLHKMYYINQLPLQKGRFVTGGYESIRNPKKSLTWAFIMLNMTNYIQKYRSQMTEDEIQNEPFFDNNPYPNGCCFVNQLNTGQYTVDNYGLMDTSFYAKNVKEMSPLIKLYNLSQFEIDKSYNEAKKFTNLIRYEKYCLVSDNVWSS